MTHVVSTSAESLEHPDAISGMAEQAAHYAATYHGAETQADDWHERARLMYGPRLCAVCMSTDRALPVEEALEIIREALGLPG